MPRLGSRQALAAAGATLAAGIVAAILSFSSSGPVAYAGRTPTLTTPTPAAVAVATAACNRHGARLTGHPVLTATRGRYTALIYVSGDEVSVCISDGRWDHTSGGSDRMILRFYAAPRPDQLGLPGGGGASAPGFAAATSPRQRLKPQIQRHVYGLAGRDISTVTFDFATGASVRATVTHGWYFAWWPGLDYPTSVRVTTASGALRVSRMPRAGCKPGRSACVFAGFRAHP